LGKGVLCIARWPIEILLIRSKRSYGNTIRIF
jgi:hypothetical protein